MSKKTHQSAEAMDTEEGFSTSDMVAKHDVISLDVNEYKNVDHNLITEIVSILGINIPMITKLEKGNDKVHTPTEQLMN